MRVSVIIPAYNAEKWLARAVDSVLSQSLPVADVIVVDDGSSDDTRRIAEAYGSSLRYLYQDNAGASAARNRGIKESEGEWIAFLDADDEWLPHKNERQVALLSDSPNLKWCCCNVEHVKNGISSPGKIPEKVRKEVTYKGSVPFFMAVARGLSIGTPGLVIHRSVLDDVGLFDTSLKTGEDRDLWWRIAMKYPRIGFCREEDAGFRRYVETPGSLTKNVQHYDTQLTNICRNMRLAEVVDRARPKRSILMPGC